MNFIQTFHVHLSARVRSSRLPRPCSDSADVMDDGRVRTLIKRPHKAADGAHLHPKMPFDSGEKPPMWAAHLLLHRRRTCLRCRQSPTHRRPPIGGLGQGHVTSVDQSSGRGLFNATFDRSILPAGHVTTGHSSSERPDAAHTDRFSHANETPQLCKLRHLPPRLARFHIFSRAARTKSW